MNHIIYFPEATNINMIVTAFSRSVEAMKSWIKVLIFYNTNTRIRFKTNPFY